MFTIYLFTHVCGGDEFVVISDLLENDVVNEYEGDNDYALEQKISLVGIDLWEFPCDRRLAQPQL